MSDKVKEGKQEFCEAVTVTVQALSNTFQFQDGSSVNVEVPIRT